MASQLIPVSVAPNQALAITVNVDGQSLRLNLALNYNSVVGYWTMDIADSVGNKIVSSIPLLTGQWPAANILTPFGYLNLGDAILIDQTGTGGIPDDTSLGSGYLMLWSDN